MVRIAGVDGARNAAWMACGWLLLIAGLAAGQQPASPIDEIPERVQQTSAMLRQARVDASPQAEVVAVERESQALEPGFRSLADSSRRLMKARPSRGILRQMQAAWGVGRARLASWQSVLKSRTASLQRSLTELREQDQWWSAIEKDAEAETIPPELRAEIVALRTSLSGARDAILARRNQVLGVQAKISGLQIELDRLDEDLLAALSAERGQLFGFDAPPIWAAPATKADAAPAAPAPNNPPARSSGAEKTILNYYLRSVAATLAALLAVWAAIVAGQILLRRRLRPVLLAEGAEGDFLLRVLGRPVSAGILATGLLVTFWPAGTGELLNGVGWLFLLVPLTRLTPLALPRQISRSVWFVLAWFIAEELLGMMPAQSLSGRLSATVVALAAGAAMLWMRRRIAALPQVRGRGLMLAGLNGALALLGVAVFGQVFGMVGLSRALAVALRDATFACFLLYTLFAVLDAALTVFLRARARAGGGDRQATGLWLHRSLPIVVLLMLFGVLLKAFELDLPAIRLVQRAFAFKVSLGALEFTFASVVTFLLVLLSAFAVSHILRFLLAPRLYDRMSLARGTSAAISKLLHYAILTAGFLLALASTGIELGKFAVIAGGLGVGVGIGLQNIINNFVSGLILLFERPVHVGDQVSVGGTSGEVTDIGIRASNIRTWEGADVVIPNGSLISSEFTNWTLSDESRRAEVAVGTAYGSDPERIIAILTGIARAHPGVISRPEPYALFTGFGDSSLNFLLRYWTSLANHLTVNSDLHREIYQRFQQEGIEIPFPQRDLHIRTQDAPPAPNFSSVVPKPDSAPSY